jgi:hypothetical protein
MHDTEAFETLISSAMVRVDHCVALVGVLCVVFAITNWRGTTARLLLQLPPSLFVLNDALSNAHIEVSSS